MKLLLVLFNNVSRFRVSGQFQAVRAMMVVGVILGVIGSVISLFSLKCFKMGSTEDSTKAKMTLTAGIMFVIAGKNNNNNKITRHPHMYGYSFVTS